MNKLLLKVVSKTLALGLLSIVTTFTAEATGDCSRSVSSDRVIDIFKELSRVPRYSGHETKIGDWLMAWAEKRGFDPTRDTAGCGNVIFDVPATEGRMRVRVRPGRRIPRAVSRRWLVKSIGTPSKRIFPSSPRMRGSNAAGLRQ